MTRNDQGVPVWLLHFQSALADTDGNYARFHTEHAAETIGQAMSDGVALAQQMGDASFVEAEETYHTDDACPLCAPQTVLVIRHSITNLVQARENLRKADMQPRIRPRVGLAACELEIARLDGGIDALNKLLTGFGLPPSPTSTT